MGYSDMSDEPDYIDGWRCQYCERKNRLDGDSRCEDPNCKGVNFAIRAKIREFPPDA
jgi:hypothetical protein